MFYVGGSIEAGELSPEVISYSVVRGGVSSLEKELYGWFQGWKSDGKKVRGFCVMLDTVMESFRKDKVSEVIDENYVRRLRSVVRTMEERCTDGVRGLVIWAGRDVRVGEYVVAIGEEIDGIIMRRAGFGLKEEV